MVERDYQPKLKKRIEEMFPGCVIIKNDEQYLQGFPDLTIFFSDGRWAILECKKSLNEPFQPNQKYYLDYMNRHGFARMICPENMEEVLHDMEQTFLS